MFLIEQGVENMRVNLKELIPIQQKVNLKVREKMDRDVNPEEFILAFNIELFEFFNAVGIWKWWKHNHKINQEKVLDELADCFAFFLSIVDQSDREKLVDIDGEDIVLAFENDVNSHLKKLAEFNDRDAYETIKDLIVFVGVGNETQIESGSIQRFAIAIYITTLLFPDLVWEDLVAAYHKKSGINIKRQEINY